jgi:hypothetical protein
MKNKKNESDKKMCSRQEDKHTNDQEWTTIDANSKRKPKAKTSNTTAIDSIISTINTEFNIDINGTLEAKIDSAVRENRCIVPDKNVYNNKKNTYGTHKQEQEKATKPTEGEGCNKPIERITPTETTVRKQHKQRQDQARNKDGPRSVKETSGSMKKEMNGEEIKKKTRTPREEEIRKVIEVTTKIVNGQMKGTQNKESGEKNETDTNKNNNDRKVEESIDKSNTNNKNNTNNMNDTDNTDNMNNTNNSNTNNTNDTDNTNNNTNNTSNTNNANITNNNNNMNTTNNMNNTNKTNNGNNSSKNNNNGSNNKTRVNIVTPREMATYTFTISWRPEQKVGQDGKIIIKMLIREMARRTPQIVFHPTNSASSAVPRDIKTTPTMIFLLPQRTLMTSLTE